MRYLKRRINNAIEYEISAFINEVCLEVNKTIEEFVRNLPSAAGHNATLESEILAKVNNARIVVMKKYGIDPSYSRGTRRALPYVELYRLYPHRKKLRGLTISGSHRG